MRITVDVTPEEFAASGLAELGRRFDELHEQLFTFSLDAQRELYNLRALVQGRETLTQAQTHERGNGDASAAIDQQSSVFVDGKDHEAHIYDRSKLLVGNLIAGPAVVTEMDSTTLILPDRVGEVDDHGNILIRPANP